MNNINIYDDTDNQQNKTIGDLMRSTLKQPETVFFVVVDRTKENGKITEDVTVEIKKFSDAVAIVDQMTQDNKNLKIARR